MAKRHRSLVVFLVLVVSLGWLMGATNLPGAPYVGLQKPSFNPPNGIFGPTWTVLYIMIAVAGWRTYLQDDARQGVPISTFDVDLGAFQLLAVFCSPLQGRINALDLQSDPILDLKIARPGTP